jgi:hypothetical protein
MTSNWWANKLGTQPAAPNYPSPTPPIAPPQPLPYNPVPQPQMPPQAAPEASREATRCPGCGSGNYGRSALAPEAKARCYDCGYPIQQSGSGAGTGIPQQGGGAPTPARQVSTANNFNPQGIIGHI